MGPDDSVQLCLFPTEYPEKFGMVQLENGRVSGIVDKPTNTDLTHMWGCIIWQPAFTEHLHTCQTQGIGDFAQVMNLAIESGMRFGGFAPAGGDYIDLGTYEEIMELDRRLRR